MEDSGRLLVARRQDEGTPELHRYPFNPLPSGMSERRGGGLELLFRARAEIKRIRIAAMAPQQDMASRSIGVFAGPAIPLGWITTTRSIAVGWTGKAWRTTSAKLSLDPENSDIPGNLIEISGQDHHPATGLIACLFDIQYQSHGDDEAENTNILVSGVRVTLIRDGEAIPYKTPTVRQNGSQHLWTSGVFASPIAYVFAPDGTRKVPRVMTLGSRAYSLASNGACPSNHFFWKPAFERSIKPGPP